MSDGRLKATGPGNIFNATRSCRTLKSTRSGDILKVIGCFSTLKSTGPGHTLNSRRRLRSRFVTGARCTSFQVDAGSGRISTTLFVANSLHHRRIDKSQLIECFLLLLLLPQPGPLAAARQLPSTLHHPAFVNVFALVEILRNRRECFVEQRRAHLGQMSFEWNVQSFGQVAKNAPLLHGEISLGAHRSHHRRVGA